MASSGEQVGDGASDYGSDFSPEEEQIVDRLLSWQPTEEDNPIVNEVEHNDSRSTLRLPRVFGREEQSPLFQAARAAEGIAEQISRSTMPHDPYPNLSDQFRHRPREEEDLPAQTEQDPQANNIPDTRSPLARFRTQPKKALSVTDLVSPAWCELQYWYTLTLHGRKKRTRAMKQGSVVHKQLEDQVHRTVRVDIETKEDAWGLRIWNVIQGLRTLRDTGLTRELEIWGVIDGLPVNGVIDELSYTCPDPELERSLSGEKKSDQPPTDQKTISEFFKSQTATSLADSTKDKPVTSQDLVYLCDVKTRSARTLPSIAAFRPTKMQLMLYHNLLSALATDTVDFSALTTRYNLDPNKIFSDAFITQVGSLNDEVYYDAIASQESVPSGTQDSMSTLLAHNTLSALWSLMISEFELTLPNGAASLGSVLKAEYRSRDNGEVVGSKAFAMDAISLKSYIDHEMEWWRGKREAEGVVVEEAFKCRSCEFAEGCEWRLKKVEEAKEKVRMARKRTAAI